MLLQSGQSDDSPSPFVPNFVSRSLQVKWCLPHAPAGNWLSRSGESEKLAIFKNMDILRSRIRELQAVRRSFLLVCLLATAGIRVAPKYWISCLLVSVTSSDAGV